MRIAEISSRIAKEVAETLARIDEERSQRLVELIVHSSKTFVVGAGRSRLMLSGFSMRLMHLGFNAFVVGDAITPAARPGDLVIAGTGSGETATVVAVARRAREVGTRLAAITTDEESTVGRLSDFAIRIDDGGSFQPGASLFEQCMLLYLDSIVVRLAEAGDIDASQLPRHANLE